MTKPLPEPVSDILSWVRSGRSGEYRLISGKDELARLRWEKRLSGTATARCGSETWSFRPVGFLQTEFGLRRSGDSEDSARFVTRWNGQGILRFTDGRIYRWTCISFWHTEWAFSDSEGRRLLGFRPQITLRREEAKLSATPAARRLPELAVLAAFGWYLMISMAADFTTAAVAGAAGSGS